MNKKVEVFKFGGASVKNTSNVRNLQYIVSKHAEYPVLVVVSAMGKNTNLLQTIAQRSVDGQLESSESEAFVDFHRDMCQELFGEVPLEVVRLVNLFKEALKEVEKSHLAQMDKILSYGELFSTTIIAKFLGAHWLDARSVIKTDEQFTEANVDWHITKDLVQREVRPLLAEGVVVTQGFIARSIGGCATTLGREGSDFSAAIFANTLQAERLTVWKDVPGLLNADPKLLAKATKFDEISYQEVIEMTYYGAKVIHHKTIYPLAQRAIPLFVKSFLQPKEPGTKVCVQDHRYEQTSYIFKDRQVLFTLKVRDNTFMDERKMGLILTRLDNMHVKTNLIHHSALTFTFCIDDGWGRCEHVLEGLSADFEVLYNQGLHLATVKNYNDAALNLLPRNRELLIEQRSRHNYQVVYRLSESV